MWNPSLLPVPDPVAGLDMAEALGWLPGVDAPDSFAPRFDRRGIESPADCSWIGEEADGIWLKRHPEVELLRQHELVPIVTKWRFATIRELRLTDIDLLSHFETKAWATMLHAHRRQTDKPASTGVGLG